MNSDFAAAHAAFLQWHLRRRKGDRRRRLEVGHAHAEKLFLENVWWPAFGHFDHLHPEYEVADFRDGTRYLDFAWIRNSIRLAIEIDGYDLHQRYADKQKFSDDRIRQNHLVIDRWDVLRFAYDDIRARPRMCAQMVQQYMGAALGSDVQSLLAPLSAEEREIVRLAARLAPTAFPPGDVCVLLGVEVQKARRLLHGLVRKKWLVPAGDGRKRINKYILAPGINTWPLSG